MKHTALRDAICNLLNTPDLNLDELDPMTVKVLDTLKYRHISSEKAAREKLLKLLDVPDLNMDEQDPITVEAINEAYTVLRDYDIAEMKK